MLSIGPDCAKGAYNEQVRRHLDYARAAGARIYMVTYAPGLPPEQAATYEDAFFVYNAGAGNQLSYPFQAYRKVMALARTVSFDLIYTQDPFGTALVGRWVRKRLGIPLIIGNHAAFIDNPYWIQERPQLFAFFNWLGKKQLPAADALKVVGIREKNKYIDRLGIPANKIYVQNTPVKVDWFSRRIPESELLALRRSLGLSDAHPVVIWVGRPVRPKRLPVLFDTFAKVAAAIPDARLLLIGKKNQMQEPLETALRQSGIEKNTIWLSEGIPNEQLPAYYQLSQVYCHTSCYEGLCKVTLEAAAAGLPVVMTDISGSEEVVIHGQTGFIAPIDDVETLSQYLIELLEQPEKARRMGASGQQRILEQFNYETGVQRLTGKWRETIARCANSRK